jgi:hypothetical protein
MDVDLEHVPSQIGTATIDINNGKILKVIITSSHASISGDYHLM